MVPLDWQVAEGVLKELHRNWGVAPGGEMQMVTALAGAWEVGADAGLAALANAVERELAVAEDRPVVKFYVNPPGGHAVPPIACEGFEGMSLRDVIEHGEGDGAGLLREMLECACSGVMACSTCHVYVEPSWLSRVGEPEEDEQARPDDAMAARYSDQPLQSCPRARPLPDPLCVRPASQDMLDLAHEPRDNSRLGCQVRSCATPPCAPPPVCPIGELSHSSERPT